MSELPKFRAFFVSDSGGVLGTDDFEVQTDAEATVIAACLANACSDVCGGFEVWRGTRRIASQRPLNGSIAKLIARMGNSTQEAVIKRVGSILQSGTRLATSKKLVKAHQAAAQRATAESPHKVMVPTYELNFSRQAL